MIREDERSTEINYRGFRRVFGPNRHPKTWAEFSQAGGWLKTYNKRRKPIRQRVVKRR